MASLWIDYVPTESNPADIPSRLHEMSEEEKTAAMAELGREVLMIMPDLVDEFGNWRSFRDIAASVWSERSD